MALAVCRSEHQAFGLGAVDYQSDWWRVARAAEAVPDDCPCKRLTEAGALSDSEGFEDGPVGTARLTLAPLRDVFRIVDWPGPI